LTRFALKPSASTPSLPFPIEGKGSALFLEAKRRAFADRRAGDDHAGQAGELALQALGEIEAEVLERRAGEARLLVEEAVVERGAEVLQRMIERAEVGHPAGSLLGALDRGLHAERMAVQAAVAAVARPRLQGMGGVEIGRLGDLEYRFSHLEAWPPEARRCRC